MDPDDRQARPGRWYGYAQFAWAFVDGGWVARLKPAALKTWLVLFKHANANTWSCFPSLMTIARSAGLNRATVTRAMIDLVEAGLIERDRGGGKRSTRYRLLPLVAPTQQVEPNQAREGNGNGRATATGAGAPRQEYRLRGRNPNQHQDTTGKKHQPTNHSGGGVATLRNGRARKLGSVTLEDLRNTERLLGVFDKTAAGGLVEDSEDGRLSFVGLAERALRVGDDPPRLFASLVNHGRWDFVTAEDEDAANARIKAFLHGDPREGDGNEYPRPHEVRQAVG